MSLRDKQIREVLDYDVFQSRRVFDNTIKQARAMNESNAQPRKSELETETTIQGQVDALYNSVKKLTGMLPLVQSASKIASENDTYDLKQYKDNLIDYLESIGSNLTNEEIETILTSGLLDIQKILFKHREPIVKSTMLELKDKLLADNAMEQASQINEETINQTVNNARNFKDWDEFSHKQMYILNSVIPDILGSIAQKEYEVYKRTGIVKPPTLAKLEIEKQQKKSSAEYDSTLASIISQYNGIINTITTKNRDAGYSKNSIEYLISMLKKVVDACKEFLTLVSSLRTSNTVLYTKSYGIIKKLVDLIEQAPPLVKLDATLLSDRYYVGEPQGEYENKRIDQYISNQKNIENTIKKKAKDVEKTGRSMKDENFYLNSVEGKRGITESKVVGPTYEPYRETIDAGVPRAQVQAQEQAVAENDVRGQNAPGGVAGRGKPRRLLGGVWETSLGQDPEEARHISNVLSQRASDRWLSSRLYPMGPYPYLPIKADNTMGRLDELQQRTATNLVDENAEIEEAEEQPESAVQKQALQGQNEGKGRRKKNKILGSGDDDKIETHKGLFNEASLKDKLKKLTELRKQFRRALLDLSTANEDTIQQIYYKANDTAEEHNKITEQLLQSNEFSEQEKRNFERLNDRIQLDKDEINFEIEEVTTQHNIGNFQIDDAINRLKSKQITQRQYDEIIKNPQLKEQVIRRETRGESLNDEELQDEGSGKKKKKNVIKMTKKAFTKEHKNLIGMLSKTSGKLGAEAKEQLGEMKRVAPEDALQVEKAIKHEVKKKELKGRGKKKEKKQTGTLQFDEKLNDVWFM